MNDLSLDEILALSRIPDKYEKGIPFPPFWEKRQVYKAEIGLPERQTITVKVQYSPSYMELFSSKLRGKFIISAKYHKQARQDPDFNPTYSLGAYYQKKQPEEIGIIEKRFCEIAESVAELVERWHNQSVDPIKEAIDCARKLLKDK